MDENEGIFVSLRDVAEVVGKTPRAAQLWFAKHREARTPAGYPLPLVLDVLGARGIALSDEAAKRLRAMGEARTKAFRPENETANELRRLGEAVESLAKSQASVAAALDMWIERARNLEAENERLRAQLALPAPPEPQPPAPKPPWWKRMLGRR